MIEDIDQDEVQLIDSIRWEIDNARCIPKHGEKEELKNLLDQYKNLLALIKEKIHDKSEFEKEWRKLKNIIGRQMNEINNRLYEYNIQKRTLVTEKHLGDRVISAVIGILKEHGWTVEPPERNN